jgi:hypothetical protein
MTSLLHDRMEAATSDIVPGQDLLAAARHEGRRRLRRRRLTSTVTLAVVVGLTALSAVTVRSWRSTAPSYAMSGPLGDGQAHGDLAGDAQYAAAVSSVLGGWLKSAQRSKYGQPLGSPKIVWAGTTPSGPAAIAEQTVEVAKRRKTGLWFIGTGPTGPRVVADNLDHPRTQAWYVDPDRRVLAVVDPGTPREVAFRWKYTADGQARHAFEPLPFNDGVAVVKLPPDVKRDTVVVADQPFLSPGQIVGIANGATDSVPVPVLAWLNPASKAETLIPFTHTAGQTPVIEAAPFPVTQRLYQRAMHALETHSDPGTGLEHYPTWFVYGTTPRGRQIIVFDRELGSDPSRLYALVDSTMLDLGAVDLNDPLPVRLHLADGEGWVVAHYGTALKYRIDNGPWTDAGPDAALVPDNTTSVAVVSPTGQQQVVRLSAR